LTVRVADGETKQSQIEGVIADALVVQANKVDKTGDTMTGRLNAPRIAVDSPTLESGRVFEAKFQGETNAWINADGQVRTNFVLDDDSEFKTLTTKKYVDDKDAGIQDTISEIQSDVSTLEAKVDALEATVLDGKWQLDSRSVAGAGKFLPLSLGGTATEWSDVVKLQMNPTSYDNRSFTFAEVAVEDVVRIGFPGSSAAFKVTSLFVQTGDVYEATVQLLSSEGQPVVTVIYDFEFLPSFDPSAYATVDYVDEQDEKAVKKSGINTVDTNFKLKTTNKTFINISENELNLYHVPDPEADTHAANQRYVDNGVAEAKTYTDQQIAAIPEPTVSSVPVGSIVIWINSTAPAGWFKLQGGTFDVDANPRLHAYLQTTEGYTSGRLPNWGGHYPGEYGDHLTGGKLGVKKTQQTAKPAAGTPKSSRQFPDGTTRTFTATGNTNAYSAGARQVEIDTNWDSVTRPKTVVVHYIIKGD